VCEEAREEHRRTVTTFWIEVQEASWRCAMKATLPENTFAALAKAQGQLLRTGRTLLRISVESFETNGAFRADFSPDALASELKTSQIELEKAIRYLRRTEKQLRGAR
jgi:hypothetical protein